MPRIAKLLIAGLVLGLVTAAAAAQDRQALIESARRLAERNLAPCAERDASAQRRCEDFRQIFIERYARAIEGDIGSQRRIAGWLRAPFPPVRADDVELCAWRLMIVATNRGRAAEEDLANIRLACLTLTKPEQAAAQQRGQQLVADFTNALCQYLGPRCTQSESPGGARPAGRR